MKKEGWITIVVLIVIWFCLSLWVQHDLILPSPIQVFLKMMEQLENGLVFEASGKTAYRMLVGLFFSFGAALSAVLIQNRFPAFSLYFEPINGFIRTVPTITFIILSLIWLGQEKSVTAVIFFLLFPTFYSNLSLGWKQFHEKTDELLKIYPVKESEKNFMLALPMLRPVLISSMKLAFGLGFKVAVMAEIMNQVRGGIGRQMSLCKANLDTAGIFAWTIWILLICFFMNVLFDRWIEASPQNLKSK